MVRYNILVMVFQIEMAGYSATCPCTLDRNKIAFLWRFVRRFVRRSNAHGRVGQVVHTFAPSQLSHASFARFVLPSSRLDTMMASFGHLQCDEHYLGSQQTHAPRYTSNVIFHQTICISSSNKSHPFHVPSPACLLW